MKSKEEINSVAEKWMPQGQNMPLLDTYTGAMQEYADNLVWRMIDDWQCARDQDDEEYLSEPRFSFMDIEADLYEYLSGMSKDKSYKNPLQAERDEYRKALEQAKSYLDSFKHEHQEGEELLYVIINTVLANYKKEIIMMEEDNNELLKYPNYLLSTYQLEIYRQVGLYMGKNNLKQKDVAKQLKFSNAYISQILKGKFNFTLKKLIELGLAIGKIPYLEFIDQSEYWRREKQGRQDYNDGTKIKQ